MVGTTRGLQLVRNAAEREKALALRINMLKNIGTLARGPGAERYAQLKDYSGPPIEFDDAPLLGTPDEIIARLKKLEAGGVEHVLLVDPTGSIATLQVFAKEVMPAFAEKKSAKVG
jgi:alkanesulfonate monooxygenase SsuD/methylene tetrahydromethanopterin reductase-like flavin-dependent oxidoreductase (luciferase family)